MPSRERHKTRYVGVYYVIGRSPAIDKPERVYFITYRRDGKLIEEKAWRSIEEDMTPARAAQLRAQRIAGAQESNQARREAQKAKKDAEANRWTFDRLWEEYKARHPIKGIAIDENRYRTHLQPLFGHKEPSEVTQFEVDGLRVKLLRTKKPQTVKNTLALFVRLSHFAVKKQLCPGVGFHVEMPRTDNLKTEELTPAQLTALLDSIDEDPCEQARGIMRMALFTGMRRGEMFKLKWDDVDFERGFIHIRHDPKGGKSQTIPLNDAAWNILENHPRTSEYVFPGRNGEKRQDVNHQTRRIVERAGLSKDFRPLHGLRHVYASMLASSGQVDMYTLQRLLTHKSPLMTQRYAHLRDETLCRASDLAGRLVVVAVSQAEAKAKAWEAQVG